MNEIIEANYEIVQERTPDVIIAEIRIIEGQVTKTVIMGAIEIGKKLEEAKEKVGHGNFEKWCSENLDYSKAKAERFMRISKEYGKENSAYLESISKTSMWTDLSIHKALRLLSLDEEDVKEFTENHEINDLTVKELEEEIRKLKAENEDAGKLKEKIEKLQDSLKTIEEEKSELQSKYKQIEQIEQSAGMSEEVKAEIESKEKEIEALQKKLEKAQEKADKLQEEKENIELEKEADIEQAKAEAIAGAEAKAKEEAKAETEAELKKLNEELEAALIRADSAEKKLSLNNNEDITAFKLKTEQLQKIVIEISDSISNIEENDSDKAESMKGAFKKLLQALSERV